MKNRYTYGTMNRLKQAEKGNKQSSVSCIVCNTICSGGDDIQFHDAVYICKYSGGYDYYRKRIEDAECLCSRRYIYKYSISDIAENDNCGSRDSRGSLLFVTKNKSGNQLTIWQYVKNCAIMRVLNNSTNIGHYS